MRRFIVATLSLALLWAAVWHANADERADVLLNQIEDAISAANPVLADFTITYTYQGNRWVDTCRTIRMDTSAKRSVSRSYAKENPTPQERLPRISSQFDPLLSNFQPFPREKATLRYMGTVTEGETLYKILEVRYVLKEKFRRNPPPNTTESVIEQWYIGIDGMIHRMTGEVRLVPDGKEQEAQAVQVEAQVTTLRKPQETRIDPKSVVRPIHTLESAGGTIEGVAYSPNGRLLAFGCYKGPVQVWDTQTWNPLPVTVTHTGLVEGVAFSPDSSLLATGSTDKTVIISAVGTGQTLRTLDHPSSVASVAFSPDGKLLATGADKVLRIWEVATGALKRTLEGYAGAIVKVAFSPDGRWLASCGWDNTARLWNTATWQEARTFAGYSEPVFSVVFSPDSRLLATTSRDGLVKVWDTRTGALRHTLTDPDGLITSVAFAQQGKVLVAGYEDRRRAEGSDHPGVKFWDTMTWQLLHALSAVGIQVSPLTLSPDEALLVAGSQVFSMPPLPATKN